MTNILSSPLSPPYFLFSDLFSTLSYPHFSYILSTPFHLISLLSIPLHSSPFQFTPLHLLSSPHSLLSTLHIYHSIPILTLLPFLPFPQRSLYLLTLSLLMVALYVTQAILWLLQPQRSVRTNTYFHLLFL